MQKVMPFSNGTDFMLWEGRNCELCNISACNNDSNNFKCHIDEALTIAYLDDGMISKTISDKIGFRKDGFLNDCPYKNKIHYKPIKLNLTVFKHQQLKLF